MKYKIDELLSDVKAVLFDLDGTLIDSMWMWKDIDKEYLGKRNIVIPEDLQPEIEGMSFRETAEYFKKRFNITDSVEIIEKEWHDMAYSKYVNDVFFKDGAIDFLKELKHRGIKTAITTSNSIQLVKSVLTARKAEELFDYIVTASEVGAGKPAPDIYLNAAAYFGLTSKECLVFEDVPMGILAGKNAGMKVVAIEDEFSAPQRAKKLELSDYYIDCFNDIEK